MDEAVSFRDKGGKGAIVAPVQEAPAAANDQFPADYFEKQEAGYLKAKRAEDARTSALYAPRDEKAAEGGPSFATRQLAAVNEGLSDSLGAPVDLTNAALGAIGLPVSDKPFLGSESVREGLHSIGIGQMDEGYAPRSALEKYTQAASRGVGQAVVPAGGLPALGGRAALIAKATAPVAARTESLLGKVAQAAKAGGRTMLVEAAKAPAVVAAAEVAGGAGSGLGAQTARDVAPGNPYAEVAGSMIGGMAGGLTVGSQLQKGITPAARAANIHADNPHLGIDAAVATDVERVVSTVTKRDAMDRKISAAARHATMKRRVDALAKSYLPTRKMVEALTMAPSQKQALRDALDNVTTLAPEDIDALRLIPHGDAVADAVTMVQRLRTYVPEGSPPRVSNEGGLGGTLAETIGVAAGSHFGGPAGAVAGRVGGRFVASQFGSGDGSADAIKALAGRASILRKVAKDQGFTLPSTAGGRAALASRLNEAQDEALSLAENNRQIGIRNDRDNVKPNGGYRGMIYDQVGILPATQDRGAIKMVADGVISPEQFDAFLKSPDKLQEGRGGLAILDRLASMADEGHLERDPSWSSPEAAPNASPALQRYQDATGAPIRNPIAYEVTARGNQERVSQVLTAVRNKADLDDLAREAILGTITKIGTTSDRIVADKLIQSAVRKLPVGNRSYARSVLQPLAEQIKQR